MSNLIIQQYTTIPDVQEISLDRWEEVVSKSPEKYGVVWLHKYDKTSATPASENVQRGTPSEFLWRKVYYCHRAGKKQIRKDVVPGGKSNKRRLIQKASKKIGCIARLVVACPKANPSTVKIFHQGEHNHHIGSLGDIQHLPLSNAVKDLIAMRISEGYRQRDIRVSLQRHFSRFEDNDIPNYRDLAVHMEDIYNIFRKISEGAYKLHPDQITSVRLWLRDLKIKGFDVFIDEEFDREYTFGFCSSWQKDLLLQCPYICLDATHNTTTIKDAILYTIVVRHPVTGSGCPVAYLFTANQTSLPLVNWFSFLKGLGFSNVRKITIDCSISEESAIRRIFPDASIQWCLFHVTRAWTSQVRKKINLGSQAENKRVYTSIIKTLKSMMWERNRSEFTSKLAGFIQEFSQYADFMIYFKQQWLDNDDFLKWSAAYQPQVFTNMETNNYVESWHNQLKTTYLERKRNRRIDRLIFILVNDVEIDIRHTITRMQLNVGRMGPEERERRRREIAAQEIPDTVIEDMVEQSADYIFTVKSFTQEDVTYDVTVSNNAMTSCSCRDFQWRQSACKHMHLLHRVKPNLEILVPPQLEIANPISVRTPIESLQGHVTTDDVLVKLQIVEEQARSLMPSLTAEQKSAILQHLQAIQNVLNIESTSANANLTTQRR